MAVSDVGIVVVDGKGALVLADQLAEVYRRAFGAPDHDPDESARRFLVSNCPKTEADSMRHLRNGQVVGLGYGYTGQRGYGRPHSTPPERTAASTAPLQTSELE